MTVRYYPGTTDPDLSARANAPTAQAAESMPAVLREQERIAFKDAHRHLELYEVPDAWGRPMFKHYPVEARWLGWIARASHGQAPAGAAEELALTRHINLAVVQRLQAKINALEAELDASRKAESQVQSYADDLDRRAQYDADNLADACGGYGGERI